MPDKQIIKNRWNVTENFFVGITFSRWSKLLRQNKVGPIYWPRATFITLASLVNSFIATFEKAIYSSRVASIDLTSPPIFILGHWRSGTTKVMAPLFDLLSDSVRPMDNVEMGMKMPQEDEFAPMLETLYSVYLSMAFPSKNDYYKRYLSFDDVENNEREEWKKAFMDFSKKLMLKNHCNQSILYKTPSHTARIKILLEMFPDAKFIHISRSPYEVIRSSQHFFDKAVWKYYLQKPDLSKMNTQIIDRYNETYDACFKHSSMISEENLISLRFENFVLDPKSDIQRIYEKMNIPNFSNVKTKLNDYIDTLKNYKRNKFTPLSDELQEEVRRRCERHFNNLDYPLDF